MQIAINTRLLLPHRLDGIGWFTAETVRRMVCNHPEHDFFFLFDRKPDPSYIYAPNVQAIVLHPQARHPVLWWVFFEWSVTRALRKLHIDLFLSTDGWISLRTTVPTLTVIHDLNFEHATDYLRPSHQRYMKHFFPRFAHKATRIATVSEFSKQDIATTYGVDLEKIDVVYDGAHSDYHPCSEEEQCQVRKKYTQGEDFFIFIGTISRRKNLTRILAAFDRMKSLQHSPVKLLVVGSRYWWQDELKETYDAMHHQKDVVFVGHVDSDELARMLSAALALVYPSLFEGFGIPIVEAFHARTAVITANVTSMPEVAGEAALLVNPYSVEEIEAAMTRIWKEPELRNDLIEKGWNQRDVFNWDRTALLLWESALKTIAP